MYTKHVMPSILQTKTYPLVPMIQTSFTPGDLWSNPVAVADLQQLWTDAQGAAGGGARSGLQ